MGSRNFIKGVLSKVMLITMAVFCLSGKNVKAANFAGLSNAGNSCYMNALVQQLYHLDKFREAILEVDKVDMSKQPVIYSLQGIFKTIKDCSREGSSVNVSHFMRSFGSKIYKGSPGNAEYAFFQIINKCDSEFIGEREHFSKLFFVENNLEYTCEFCNDSRTRTIANQIGFTYDGTESNKLNNVLTTCSIQEKFECSNCKRKDSLIRKSNFKVLGNIFMLWTFCEHPIDYQESYTLGSKDEYKISGVIMGNSFHAYSYVRDKSSNCWYRLNDGSVSNVGSFQNIKNECFSQHKGVYATSVFYEKI